MPPVGLGPCREQMREEARSQVSYHEISWALGVEVGVERHQVLRMEEIGVGVDRIVRISEIVSLIPALAVIPDGKDANQQRADQQDQDRKMLTILGHVDQGAGSGPAPI